MTIENNPYAVTDDNVVAALAPTDARVAFLQKTYSLLLAGILVFAGTLWMAGIPGPVYDMAKALFGINQWIYLIVFIGGAMAVHAMAETRIGIVVFFAFAFFWGLLSAPLILTVAASQPQVISQAALITAMIFTGLTAYVFKSGKDFGFMGGFLWAGMFGMLGVAIAGLLFGFNVGIWYSWFGAALFSGFILYDTSNILNRYPTTAHVSAALTLFVDVVILFKHLIMIFMSRD